MKIIKRINFLQVLGIIIMLVSFILGLFNIKGMEYLFFVGLAVNGLGFTLLTIKWSKEGKTGFKKMDKNYDKNLTRKSSDTMLFMNLSYYFVLWLSIIVDLIEDNYSKGIFSVIPLLALSLVVNYALLYLIDNTYNQVIEIIQTPNKKIKKNSRIN